MGSTEIPCSTAGDLEPWSHLAIMWWHMHTYLLHRRHGKACNNNRQNNIKSQQCAGACVMIRAQKGVINWPSYYLVDITETNLISMILVIILLNEMILEE